MKTIKVIDLLNKIANGEEVPRKIKYDGITYTIGWSDYMGDEPITDYYNHELYGSWFSGTEMTLDKEVEIIEEDKEIEKGIKPFEEYLEEVKVAGCDLYEAKKVYLDRLSKIVIELTEAVNELKKGK